MKCISFVFRPLLALGLWVVMPAASAFLLSTQANNDPHPSPITSPAGLMALSGSATAADNGIPNQYPGRVVCRGQLGTCNFGPVASSMLTGGLRFIVIMGCGSNPPSNCEYGGDTSVSVNTNMTWDQAISAWRARYGTSLSRYNAYTYPARDYIPRICHSWATFSFNAHYLLPGADSCGPAPIPPNQCNVSGATVALNHGQLNLGEINGKKVEVTRQVTCTRAASVTYTVSSGNPVNLGNGILSTISVNGVNAGRAISLPGGASTLRIASTLTDSGAVAGPFSKTVVLIQTLH